MNNRERITRILGREDPGAFVCAPNYWQWFAHQRNHGTLPAELDGCETLLDMIRRLGLAVFSRNVYCDQRRAWYGGLARPVYDTTVEVVEREFHQGSDLIIERIYRTRTGDLAERLRYVHAESTLVQESFLLDDPDTQMDAFQSLVEARRWTFDIPSFERIRRQIGDDGLVVAGELCSPLKLLHFAAGADQAVFILMDHPEQCAEIMTRHEARQLELVKTMAGAGVEAMMSMDNLDTMFHPPPYVDQYSASFYEKAASRCHEHGATFFIHACGKQRDNLARIAALGVDGLEGVAFPPLGDVELDEAMALAGDDFIITGGISAHETRTLTTRDAVFAYVGNLFDRMRPYRNRFILSASCNTAIDTPFETLLHFRDAWREYFEIGSDK